MLKYRVKICKAVKLHICIFAYLHICISVSAQSSARLKLYIVDSIHFLNATEVFHRIDKDDIADSFVIATSGYLKLPAGKTADTVVCLFTKAYRQRPDSLKKFPSLLQMTNKGGTMYLGREPYNGIFFDYYVNGNIQRQGSLMDGKIHGECIVYYPNSTLKTISNYDWGIRHGLWEEYYRTGAMAMAGEFSYGRLISSRSFFLNGQLKHELRRKNKTAYDTLIVFYSTGKIKAQQVSKKGNIYPNNKEMKLEEDSYLFYQTLAEGDLKKANKYFYRIWKADSGSLETHFQEAVLMMKEYRFDEAISHFNRVLEIEPFLQLALENRALARMKKYRYPEKWNNGKDDKDFLVYQDLSLLPEEEKLKVCSDLQLAEKLDLSLSYRHPVIPRSIIEYCRRNAGR